MANTNPMLFNPSDSKSTQSNDDDTSAGTIRTPPETVTADLLDDHESLGGTGAYLNMVPWPGSLFIIRSVTSGHVITLHDGHIALAPPGGPGSIHWECVETKGWLGFRNNVSGKYLGHDKKGNLCCSVDKHQGWEYFNARARPEGGCVLLMQHWESLKHVGMKVEQGVEKLAKIGDGGDGGMVFEFLKVESSM